MNLYHIKLTDNQKAALEHLFSLDIAWNKTELEKAWNELREQLKESVQCVAIINALHQSDDDWETKQKNLFNLMIGRRNTKTAPKHAPYRKFRKRDIVEPSVINGRIPEELLGCYRYEVIVGEGDMSDPLYVTVKPLLAANYKHLREIHVNAVFLKLVTPVEALEAYFVGESENSYDLFRKTSNGNQLRASFWWKHNPTPDLIELSKANAKAAAEAERDRLNAEWRKEQP